MFATVAMSGDPRLMPYGVTRLLGGIAFSLGLILVMPAGARLFTGDTLMVMAWASGKLKTSQVVKTWITVWCGNFVGSVGTAALVFLAGGYLAGHGQVGVTALHYAVSKSNVATGQAFLAGIMCNVCVCLAVWPTWAAGVSPTSSSPSCCRSRLSSPRALSTAWRTCTSSPSG